MKCLELALACIALTGCELSVERNYQPLRGEYRKNDCYGDPGDVTLMLILRFASEKDKDKKKKDREYLSFFYKE